MKRTNENVFAADAILVDIEGTTTSIKFVKVRKVLLNGCTILFMNEVRISGCYVEV